MKTTLNFVCGTERHVVTQGSQTEFVVGAVGDISLISGALFSLGWPAFTTPLADPTKL